MFFFIFFVVLIIIQIYAHQAVKTAFSNKVYRFLYYFIVIGVFLNFFIRIFLADRNEVFEGFRAYSLGYFLAVVAAQIVLVLFVFGEDLKRVIKGFLNKKKSKPKDKFLPSRRKFVSQMAMGIASVPFLSLIYGMYQGKYNFKVFKYELEFEDLPDAFDGYKITHISDIHVGSFDNFEKVKYGVELINEQKSDVICFTGDLVNSLTSELDDWKDLFSTLSAPDGVFSVLGNHDYGMYYNWDSEEAQQKDHQALIQAQKEMGWDLMMNENRKIEKNGKSIHLVGVENWGNGRFPKYGDENKAAGELSSNDFKILLSHDPSHWSEKIQDDPRNYQLTLSGHTHGMQFGIEIPGVIKLSPARFRYKYWAGIYKVNHKIINVNRGFGYVGYPGRVGMWPEVTVITLRKK